MGNLDSKARIVEIVRNILASITCCIGLTCSLNMANAQQLGGPLNCNLGSNSDYGSSWCDLSPAVSFSAGQIIEITLGTDGAQRVLVRLLPDGHDPSSPTGLLAGVLPVLASGKVVVNLTRNYTNIKQISVHGGANPWGHSLGQSNGPANIIEISVH